MGFCEAAREDYSPPASGGMQPPPPPGAPVYPPETGGSDYAPSPPPGVTGANAGGRPRDERPPPPPPMEPRPPERGPEYYEEDYELSGVPDMPEVDPESCKVRITSLSLLEAQNPFLPSVRRPLRNPSPPRSRSRTYDPGLHKFARHRTGALKFTRAKISDLDRRWRRGILSHCGQIDLLEFAPLFSR